MILLTLISIALGIIYFLFVLLLVIGWISKQKKSTLNKKISFSILIPFRNEEHNIQNLIESINALDYPKDKFEVVFIDDNSSDSSVDAIKGFLNNKITFQNLSLKMVGLEGKKAAIEIGVEQAKHPYIVTSDADCVLNPNWLQSYSGIIANSNPSMILGAVKFNSYSFFEKIQALDFMSLVGTTFSTLHLGFPIMNNGANLCYSKATFYAVNGYKDINDTPSGDDVFLMQKFIDQKYSVVGNLSPDAIVETKAQTSIKALFNQRIRWASKLNGKQSLISKLVGLLVLFVNLTLLLGIITSVVDITFLKILWFPLVSKFVIDFLFLFLVSSFFKEKRLLLVFFTTEMFNVVFIPVVAIFSVFGKFNWKGRHYKN